MLKIFPSFIKLLSIICFLFGTSCLAKLTDEELLENAKKMEKIIEKGMKMMNIPGVAFAVSRANKPIYYKAIGQTTIPSNSPKKVSETTLFPVSSITKNITAILVGALVDEGKLSFDDKVRKYVPTFFVSDEETSNEFTVLDLISHRSGYNHFSADTLFKAGYDKQKILDAFKYLKRRPGEFRKYYGYQNIIYAVIGMVIESATGEKYEDLVKKYIFDKLDMRNSSAIRLDAEASKYEYAKYLVSRFSHDNHKIGFFKAITNLISAIFNHNSKDIVTNHGRYREEILPLDQIGFFHKFPSSTGISLSAEDFSKWIAMLANGGSLNGKQIVSKETFEKITSKIAEVRDLKDDDVTFLKSRYSRDGLYYGIGSFTGTYFDEGKNARKIIFHMGGVYGSTAFLAILPEEDVAIGVVCNLGGVALTLFPEYMVNQFLDICLGYTSIDWAQADVDRKNKFKEKQAAFSKGLAERDPTPMENLNDYVGTYSSKLYGDVTITIEDGKLILSNGIKKTDLKHVNGSIFSFPSKNMMFVAFDEDEYASFFKDNYGKINSLYLSCFDENNTVFEKKQ